MTELASPVIKPARPRGRAFAAIALSLSLLVVAVLFSLTFGEVDSPWSVIVAVRLPRVLLGVIAGAGLSAVGVALQALLRNPLAEPYVLGVSGGSALGAVVVIALGVTDLTLVGASLIPVAALVGGLLATAVVYALASNGRGNATSLLLSGVIVNAIASAAITFIKTLVTAGTAQEMLYWLMGFLDAPSNASLAFVGAYVAVGLGVLLMDAGKLNLLALGPSAASHLGLDVRALERRTLLACSLIVGAITSATGMIGFIGLIVPHAIRRIAGTRYPSRIARVDLGRRRDARLVRSRLASRVSRARAPNPGRRGDGADRRTALLVHLVAEPGPHLVTRAGTRSGTSEVSSRVNERLARARRVSAARTRARKSATWFASGLGRRARSYSAYARRVFARSGRRCAEPSVDRARPYACSHRCCRI